MKTNQSLITALAFLAFASPALASQDYKIVSHTSDDTGIRFDVPYTAGTHHGFSKAVAGDIVINLDPIEARSVALKIPITSMTTGDTTRDCHMRESLGINYAGSRFPGEHVCDANHQLPSSGPDSVVYSNVELTILRIEGAATTLDVGKSATVTATVRMGIHGVTKDFTIPLKIDSTASAAPGAAPKLHVSSTYPVLLSDFGIVVKPFLFIKVSNQMTVKIDLNLEPK